MPNTDGRLSKNATVLAVVALTFMALAAIVVLRVLRPEAADSAAIVVALTVPTIVALLALLKAGETHQLINSRMDEMLRLTAAAARAEGKLEGGGLHAQTMSPEAKIERGPAAP